MKPADLNSIILTFLIRKIRKKILNLKLPIMFEYQHIETFLQKVTLQIGLKKLLRLKNLKIIHLGYMVLVILMVKKLLKRFTEKNCKKQVKTIC